MLAPPHLVQKWQAELVDVIPGCLPHIADKDPATGGTLVDDVAAFMRRANANPDRLHVLVLSREKAKLAEGWQPAYQVRTRRFARWPAAGPVPAEYLDGAGRLMPGVTRLGAEEIAICPTCGAPITSSQNGQGKTSPIRWMKTQPRKCRECGGALWQLVRTFSAPGPGEKYPKRNPRYPIASLLRERYPDRVAVSIIDEVYEYKSSASDQGRAMQDLVHIADYAVGMTGTLLGGTASSVFWLEWAFKPARMVKDYSLDEGIEPAINRWVRSMGVMVKTIELVSQKQVAAALLGGDADGGGLAQLSGGAASLEAELARSIAADEAVVDVSKLFRQTARASADFTSGWATGKSGGASSSVVPLQNLIGKRFAHQGGAFEVVDYGPLDQAAYRVKNLAGSDISLLAAETVMQASMLPVGAPIPSTSKPAPRPIPPVSRRPTLDELARRHGYRLPGRPLPAPSMHQQIPLFGLASTGGD